MLKKIPRKIFMSFLLSLFMLIASGIAEASSSKAIHYWKKGYEIFEKAEEFSLAGQKNEALNRFREALECFMYIRANRPDWNSKMIRYRIGLCKRRIEGIEFAMKAAEKSRMAEPRLKGNTSGCEDVLKVKNEKLERELSKYKNKLFNTVLELENVSRKHAAEKRKSAKYRKAEERISALLRENNDLKNKYTLLFAKYNALNSTKGHQNDSTSEVIAEKVKYSELLEKMKTKDAELDDYKRNIGKQVAEKIGFEARLKEKTAEIEQLKSEVKTAKARVAELATARVRLAGEIGGLRDENKNLSEKYNRKSSDYDRLYGNLNDLRKEKAPEAFSTQLREENACLRNDCDALKDKLEKLRKEKNAISETLNKKIMKVGQLDSFLVEIEKNRKVLEGKNAELTKKIDEKNLVIAKNRAKAEKMEKSLSTAQGELKIFTDRYNQLQKRFDEKETIALKNFSFVKKNEALKAELDRLKKASGITEEKLKKALNKIEAAENDNHKLLKEKTKSQEEYNKLLNSLKALEESLKKAGEDSALLKKKKATLEKKVNLLSAKLEKAENKDDLKRKLEQKNKVISTLKSRLKAFAEENKAITERFAALEEKKKAPEKSNKTIPPENKTTQPASKQQKTTKKKTDSEKQNSGIIKISGSDDIKKTSSREKSNKRKTVDADPETVSFLMNAGLKARDEGDMEAALWHFDKVLKLDPENFNALKETGVSYYTADDYPNAVIYMEKALAKGKHDNKLLLIYARATLRNKEYQKALNTANRLVLHKRKSFPAHLLLGDICLEMNKKDWAEKKYKDALKLKPEDRGVLIKLATLLSEEKDRLPEGAVYYSKALKNGAEPVERLKNIYAGHMKKEKKTEPELKKKSPEKVKKSSILDKKPESGGKSKKKQLSDDNGTEKKKHQLTAREKNKVNSDTVAFLLKKATEAEKKEETQKVLWNYEKALAYAPDNSDLMLKLAELYGRTDPSKKLRMLEKANEIDPANLKITLPLASIYIKQGKNKEPLALLNETVLIHPDNPVVHQKIGVICVRIKKKKLAEKAFLKSFKLAPDSALTAMLLAELYTFTFKTKLNEGKKWYEKALELGAKRSERLDAFYAGGRKKRDERKAK